MVRMTGGLYETTLCPEECKGVSPPLCRTLWREIEFVRCLIASCEGSLDLRGLIFDMNEKVAAAGCSDRTFNRPEL